MAFNLLPMHAVFSCIRPCFFIHGAMQGMYLFSGWLGQNSKASKGKRLLRELQQRLRLKITGNKREVRLEYLPIIVQKLFAALKDENINEAIEFMDDYYLTRDDFESLVELGYQDGFKDVPTKTKSSFTRQYNSTIHLSPFDIYAAKSKSSGSSSAATTIIPDSEEVLIEDEVAGESDSSEETEAPVKKVAKKPVKKAAVGKKASSNKKK